MKALYFVIKSALTLLTIVALMGCMDKYQAETTMPIKSTQKIKTTKPGAAIRLISSSLISIKANELTYTDIVLDTTDSQGDMIIDFSASQGLSLVSKSTPQAIKLNNSAPIKIPVSLLARVNGRYYLNMHISLNNTDAISVRNLAVIVQVGPLIEIPAVSQKSITLQKVTGENIIILPAQETISNQ